MSQDRNAEARRRVPMRMSGQVGEDRPLEASSREPKMTDKPRLSWTAASPRVGAESRSGDKQAGSRARDERGQAYLEFILAAPLLLALLTAVFAFGVAFDHYLALRFATNTGAQLLSISRGQTTDPCKTASQAVYSAAPQLAQSNLKFSIVLDGTSVTSNSANPSCSGSQEYLVQSQAAQVTVTYPCNLAIFGLNPVTNCALTAQSTVFIQ